MTNNYQLTKHPVGSIKEIWAMSWPLMMGLISNSLMIFADRILLSWHSSLALNACANAGMAYYLFLVIPLAICAISEVLVGKLHGEGLLNKIGNAAWQLIWFSVCLIPLFWGIAEWLPPYIFYKSGNETYEISYFATIMRFAPFLCITIALSGFFIAIGNVRIITYSTILGNILNIFIGSILIFGWGPIPSMGIYGAGIATGVSQIAQTLLLLYFFLKKKNRSTYGTHDCRYNQKFFIEGIRIGAPAGLGHAVEVFAHFLFFRIVMMVGQDHMTVVAAVQSFYLLVIFMIEALSKGVSAIIANLIGARKFDLISGVFKSALKLHTLFFIILAGILLKSPNTLLNLFVSGESAIIFQNPFYESMFYQATIWMSIFFLFDGFTWILIGCLTASGDTKFIFYVSALVNLVAFLFPVFLLVGIGKNGANVAWMIMAIYSAINFLIYLHRYRSGKWLEKQRKEESRLSINA